MCCGWKFTAIRCWEHVSQVEKGSYHLQLVRSDLDFPMWSAVQEGMQFPGTVYICNQGPIPSTWSHCISCAPSACSHCRKFCSCPLQCDRQHMKLIWTLQEVQARTTDHDLRISCIYSVLSPPLLLSKSRASWHLPPAIQRWLQGHWYKGPPRGPQSGTRVARLHAQWWRASGWVQSSWTPTFTSNFTVPLTNMDMAPLIGIHPLHQSHNPHQVFSAPTWQLSEVLHQKPSPGLQKPCRISCW